MAALTITISNQLYPLGPDVCTPSLWGTFQWGGKWLYSATDSIMEVEKLVTNSIAPTSAELFEVEKLVDNAITPSDDYANDVERTITNTLAPSFDTTDEELSRGDWAYVFVRPSTNAENRNLITFTTAANASTVWTSGTVTSTTWS